MAKPKLSVAEKVKVLHALESECRKRADRADRDGLSFIAECCRHEATALWDAARILEDDEVAKTYYDIYC